jgi:hypothetical protein
MTRTDVLRMVKRRALAAGLFYLLPHVPGNRYHRVFGDRRIILEIVNAGPNGLTTPPQPSRAQMCS